MKTVDFAWKGEGGIPIVAVEWRPESAPWAVIALVHGIGEHFRRYESMAAWYAEKGIATLAFDLPGHGKSGGPRGHSSYATIAKEIDHLVGEARGRFPGLPIVAYGHSLGGALCLNWLLERQPDIGAAVIGSPGLAPATPIPPAKMALARIMARLAPSFTLANDLDDSGLSRDPKVKEAYIADPLMHNKVSARLGLDLIERGQFIIANAAKIKLPLLLLQGTADRLVDPAATASFAAAAGANVEFRRFEGWYHELHNEPEKEELYKQVLTWIEGRFKPR